MRKFGVALLLLAGVAVGVAQLFNLEDEDKVVVPEVDKKPNTTSLTSRSTATKANSKSIIKLSAPKIPDADPESKDKLDTLYNSIMSALKANDVKKATAIISNYDVITKQKIVYRLMQENPDALRLPAGTTLEKLSPQEDTPTQSEKLIESESPASQED